MARRLRPVGLEFLKTAPVRLVFAREVFAPARTVYAALADDVEGWPEWFTAVTSAGPVDGGRGRVVRLRGGTRFRETILAAEPPRTYAYRVDVTNAPGLRALVEEWSLSPLTDTSTRVRWTFAAEAVAPLRLALTYGRRGLDRSFTTAVTNLDRRLARKDAS
ncbi:SRPBCC family protein [Streptomyces aureocirculatus]|uniref:SRPBCC family protein n=1 Tax=Streptomyces aureocirculatus TaxID=67275 RepID=UPI0004C6B606|nr:SRPBCC family protein [Streptomyces aureocirculatus]